MNKENIARFLDESVKAYPQAAKAEEGGKVLLKLPEIALPRGCVPSSTSALVVLDEAQPAPQLFIKELPVLPNGRTPRSCSSTPIAGETWYTFSFNQRWDESKNTAVQFVEGRLRRFALSE